MLAGQTDARARETLSRWLASLSPSQGLTTVDRQTCRRFRALLTSFLADARGLLRMQ